MSLSWDTFPLRHAERAEWWRQDGRSCRRAHPHHVSPGPCLGKSSDLDLSASTEKQGAWPGAHQSGLRLRPPPRVAGPWSAPGWTGDGYLVACCLSSCQRDSASATRQRAQPLGVPGRHQLSLHLAGAAIPATATSHVGTRPLDGGRAHAHPPCPAWSPSLGGCWWRLRPTTALTQGHLEGTVAGLVRLQPRRLCVRSLRHRA